MAGLGMAMQQPMAPAAAPAPGPAAPMAASPQPEMTMGTEAASPEEQEMYDKFVSMALLALYDQKMMPKTIEMLRAPGGAIEDKVGQVVTGITQRVYDSAKESGVELPGDVIMNAVIEIVEAVVELAEKSKIAEFDQAMIDKCYYAAMDMIGKQAAAQGLYGDDMKAQDAAALQQMSQSGELQAMTGDVSAKPDEMATAPPPAAPVGM
jgi:hypothetical protein